MSDESEQSVRYYPIDVKKLSLLAQYTPVEMMKMTTQICHYNYNNQFVDLGFDLESIRSLYHGVKIDVNKKIKISTTRHCGFCQQNEEGVSKNTNSRTHSLKSRDGIITCPVLRSYICDICGATGDNAHTRSYCPLSRVNGKIPESSAIILKSSKISSAGKVRY